MCDSKNKFLSRWLPLSIFLLFFSFSTFAQCPCTDCRCSDSLALVALYDATNGGNWTNKWTLTQPMTAWFGVTLTNGRVTCIDLDGISSCSSNGSGNNLVGTLPFKLNDLIQLTGLILSSNKLIGSISNFNLPNLRILDLNTNQLTDTIPNFTLPNLQYLSLSNNRLSGSIPNFNLPNLQNLLINKNQLSGSIPNFNLPKLTILGLNQNQLTGAIPNFNLPNLQNLDLYYNQLTEVIPNFNLPNLQLLTLSYNQLTGNIPNFNLPKLQNLSLYNNQLVGIIPDFNLPNLQNLSLYNNQLVGIIPDFNLPNLQHLNTSYNQLTGSIPNFNLPSLKTLGLFSNKLTGTIPNFTLPTLTNLLLASNELTGTIPNFNLPNLTQLWLDRNQLTGTIPNFNFPNLQNLSLNANQLTGTIPNFNFPNLSQLILNQNQLTGTIPNFNLPKLIELRLAQNQLSGCLPSGLRSLCTHVTTGDISNNANLSNQDWAAFCTSGAGDCSICVASATIFVSNITNTGATTNWVAVTGATSYTVEYKASTVSTWTALPNTTALTITLTGLISGTTYNVRVTTNCTSGTSTPSVIANFTPLGRAFPVGLPTCLEDDFRELEKFYDAAGGNNWTDKTGWFSANMGTWKGITLTSDGCSVQIINLFQNNLIGTIPNFNLPNLKDLTLFDNKLSGTIPNFNLPNLTKLWLPKNQLTGVIPSFNFPNLLDLNLSSNKLSGTIPNFNLSNLKILVLSDNQLIGTIPNFNLPNLTQLYLGNNQLIGTIPNFNLPNMADLSLDNNQLTGTIPNFNFPNMINLYLTNNQLTGTIPNFNFPNLTNLWLGRNMLTGTIPNFNFPNLTSLYLGGNQLTGSIPNFNFSNLTQLDLSQNQLTGTIPNFNFPKLITLGLRNNQLTGTIPNFNFPKLTAFWFGGNQLSGCLPSGLRSLCSHVTVGELTGNANLTTQDWAAFCANGTGECVTCTPPATPSVSNITKTNAVITWVAVTGATSYKVEYKTAAATTWTALANTTAVNAALTGLLQGTTYNVRVTANCTSGASTPSLSATYTTLGRAFPTGLPTCLEDDFRELEKLYDATDGDNWTDKTGWFSANMATWKGITLTANGCDVKDINLYSNSLIGTIPNFNLPNLQILSLFKNQLSGTIPNFNLPNLSDLNLGTNKLSGTIPNFNLPNLKSLVLITNQLSGTIPNFNLLNLIGLLLNSNQLTGSIPNFNLPNLKSLWLSSNQLSGTIPNFNLPNIQDLLLNFNQLSGTIPNFNLPSVQNLALNFNQLSGTIPNFNLLNLQRLSLQNNKLEGVLPNFTSLNKLEALFINDNLLDSLPNLSALPLKKDTVSGLQGLHCFSNKLTFDDLLPNIGFATNATFLYTPQDTIAKNITGFNTTIGSTLTIDLGIDASLTSNKYLWFKNGVRYDSSNQNKLILRGITACDAGTYKVQVTNLTVPSLTLYSSNIKVTVTGTLPTQRTDTAICVGQTYTLPNGKVVSIATNFKDTLKNRYGCDSLVRVVNLSIHPLPISNVQDVAICAGKTYTLPNGRVVNIATNFKDTLKNRYGCDSLIRVVNLSINPLPTSNVQDVVICAGKTYILPNGRVVSIATNFKDTVKSRYGCDSLIRVVNLSINPLPTPNVRDVTICPNETATLQVRNTPNNYRSFQWQNNVSTTATANYTPPLSGTYKVTVTDINGCEGIATANITVKSANDTSCITVIPKPKAVNDDIILELNQTKINFNVTTNDIFDRNLNWKVSIKERPTQGTLMDLGKGAFLYEATPNQRGLVFVKYLLCTTFRAVDYCDSAIVTINILGRDRKLPPDAITPNGDGKNDRFIIPDLDENPTKYPNNELIILNRWGQVLYQAKPYKNDWEGTNQQNLPLPDGTYYYIMRLSIADGKILTGDLLIVRD